METLNQINPINLILITAIVCFVIALVITLAVFFFIKKDEPETLVADRHVYPKKESLQSTIKSLGVSATEADKAFSDLSKIDLIDANNKLIKNNCDCACDCLGERKLEHNGELPDLYLGNDDERVKIKCCNVWETDGIVLEQEHGNSKGLTNDFIYTDSEIPKRFIDYPLYYYMKRGNKRYYRGENVKVVVTVPKQV